MNIIITILEDHLFCSGIMASHFDDTFFKILNLSFGRFARRIEVLRAGNLKLAWVMLALS
jgi:hypothetical protein